MKQITNIGYRFVLGSVVGSFMFITTTKILNFQYSGDYADYESNIYDQDILCNNEIKSLRHLSNIIVHIHIDYGNESEIKLVHNKNGKYLAIEVASLLNIELTMVKQHCDEYNRETQISVLDSVRDKDVYVLGQIDPQSNQDYLTECLLMASCCKRAFAKRVTLVLPYLPYCNHNGSMSDTVYQPSGDIAKMIESMGVDQLITFNCINPEIKGCYNIPFINIDITGIASDYLIKYHKIQNPIILTPDFKINGIRRAISMINQLDQEGVFGRLAVELSESFRKSNINDINFKYLGPKMEDQDVIIVDNKCVTAQTQINTSQNVFNKGAKRIFSFVVHSKLSGNGSQIDNTHLNEYITTNTIPQENMDSNKIRYFSIGRVLAECINRVHKQTFTSKQTSVQQVILE